MTHEGNGQVCGCALADVGGVDEVAEGGRQREVPQLAPVHVVEEVHARYIALLHDSPTQAPRSPAAQ